MDRQTPLCSDMLDTPDLMRILYRYWIENASGIVLIHTEFEQIKAAPGWTGHGLSPLNRDVYL